MRLCFILCACFILFKKFKKNNFVSCGVVSCCVMSYGVVLCRMVSCRINWIVYFSVQSMDVHFEKSSNTMASLGLILGYPKLQFSGT